MTLSALVTEPNDKKRAAGRQTIIYVCFALFCGLFSATYEHFSHQIYSNYMIWLFAFPLLLGALPYTLIGLLKRLPLPAQHTADVWDCGITTLAVGSCVTGALEIYGTTSSYTAAYWPIGTSLLAAGLILYISEARASKAQPPAEDPRMSA